MPTAKIRGVELNYQIVGNRGPWMALSPGGRRPMAAVEGLAHLMSDAGYRVIIFDRRNCGASEVSIDPSESEYVLWADDLYELLKQHSALPAIIGGSSSGCRLSLLFALRHPEAVRALLLWRVTGGAFAVNRLARQYYTQYIEAAKAGGMKAVCETEHFAERVAQRPANRDILMKMDPKAFIAAMDAWRAMFVKGADMPVIGASEADLGSIKVPTIVVPGNDKTHGNATGRNAQRLIPSSELFELFPKDVDVDLVPMEEWQERDGELAAAFIGFLQRRLAPARIA